MRFAGIFSRRISLFLLPLVGLGFLLTVNHRLGIGVAHDSLFYISMAKHIAAGKGVYAYSENVAPVSKPITRFCPFYPLILSLVLRLGYSIKTSVAALNGVLFAANIYLGSCLVFRATKSHPAALLTGLIFLLDPLWQSMHSYILTEPLFILVINLALFFLWRYLETNQRSDFIWAIVWCGIVSLTRYTGIAYALSGSLGLVLLSDAPVWQRIKRAFLFSLFSSVPLVVWLTRNVIKAYKPDVPWTQLAIGDLAQMQPGEPRSFWSYTLESGDKTLQWLTQHALVQIHLKAAVVLCLFLGGLLLAAWHHQKNAVFLRQEPRNKLPYLLCIYAVSYLFFLISYMTFARQQMEIDQRYMMIFYMYLVFLFVLGAYGETKKMAEMKSSRGPRFFFYLVGVLAFILWLGIGLERTYVWSREVNRHGADNTNGLTWLYVNTRHWFPYQRS